MISIRIGELVVVAVKTHPVDGSVLTAQGAAGGEEALQPWRHTERAMGKQAVIADRDPQAGGDPIQNQQGGCALPAPVHRQQGDDREGVDRDHEADRSPPQRLIGGNGGMAQARFMQAFGKARCLVRGCGPARWRW